MLDFELETCFFTKPSIITNSTLSTFNHRKEIYSHEEISKSPVINILLQFAEFSYELDIEPIIIEPSLLFCVLSPSLKSLLLKRKFTIANRSSDHLLTLGILQKDVAILEKEDVQSRLEKIGFQIEIVESPILSWMKPEKFLNSSMFTGHVFLQKDKWILHLVVFHQRENFMWHAALLSKADSRTPSIESLFFVDADAAFENFTAVSLGIKAQSLKSLSIPTNPASFLYQIETSRFLECNETIVNSFRNHHVSNLSTVHDYSSLSQQEFNQRLLITIEEMKQKLDPMLIRFWVWSGTLLGLHRQCDVIPYTSDADFATWAMDDEDAREIIKYFKKNEHLHLNEKLGLVEEAMELKFRCHGLSVDLFFIYEQENGTWYAGHSPYYGYYFKYHHPAFSLCSAELLGQKVNTPCEPEDVISAEYGSSWMKPVTSWSYKYSVYNRGPNIYWKKSLLKKAYPKT
ncbi:ribitol-5-phosphate transferase FKTN isoform X2 [Parasteatoda tepidariorum]|nr:fukutin isoform X2 [Parasteatoda tepidariorum]